MENNIIQWGNVTSERDRMIFENPTAVNVSRRGIMSALHSMDNDVTFCIDGIPMFKVYTHNIEYRNTYEDFAGSRMPIRGRLRISAELEEITDSNFKLFKAPGIDPIGFAW